MKIRFRKHVPAWRMALLNVLVILGLSAVVASLGLGVTWAAALGGALAFPVGWLIGRLHQWGLPVFGLFDGALVPDISVVADNGEVAFHDINSSALMWDYARSPNGMNSLMLIDWWPYAGTANVRSARFGEFAPGPNRFIDVLLADSRSQFVKLYGREPIIAWVS